MMSIRVGAALILVAGSEVANTPPKVVTIKRGSDANYLPGAMSFPGGHFDESDEHLDWLSIIPSEEQDVYLNTVISSPASVPRALSQRITAIRETFEECGILLCKVYNTPKTDRVIPVFVNDIDGWRHKLRQNSYEFLNLCRSYRCYPDTNNLYLVSRWLTAPHNSRRYDCHIYAAFTDRVIDGEADAIEVESMEWQSFSDCNKNKQIFIPPTIIYEIARFGKFQDLNSLFEFVKNLDREECESVISAVHINAADGCVSLLPGDEKYEQFRSKNDFFFEVEEDVLSFRCKIMHRIEYQPTFHPAVRRQVVIQNYPPLTNETSSALASTKL